MGWFIDQRLVLLFGRYEDPELQSYLEAVAATLLRTVDEDPTEWTFQVLDDAAIEASAAYGHYVWITRGMLALLHSEAELAGVLAHEIVHIVAGHADREPSPPDPYLRAKWNRFQLSRDDEAQADQQAVRMLERAGYDPRGVPSMLEAVYRPGGEELRGWNSRHPPLAVRLALTARAANGGSDGRTGEEEFRRAIDGLVVGMDPRLFQVVDGRYINHRAGLSFDVGGWEVETWYPGTVQSQRLRAIHRGWGASLSFSRIAPPAGFDIVADDARENASTSSTELPLAGYPATVSLVSPEAFDSGYEEGVLVQLATFRARDRYRYGLFLATRGHRQERARELLEEVTGTFRRERPGSPRPFRLRHMVLDRPSTLDQLIASDCVSPGAEILFRHLNALVSPPVAAVAVPSDNLETRPSDVRASGTIIKCVRH
ncbi:MAG: M48 family metalloprotease [Myxococcota bacterium]